MLRRVAITELPGYQPLHGKSAYPWLRGSRPCVEVRADVLTALRQHSGRPLTAADLGWDGPRRRAPRGALDTPYEATATDLLRETQKEDLMHRRTFVLLTGAAVTGPALDLLLDRAGPLRAAQDGDRVSAQLALCRGKRSRNCASGSRTLTPSWRLAWGSAVDVVGRALARHHQHAPGPAGVCAFAVPEAL
ncbi:MAG TPA: hypothetical protein VN327_04280 [Pseudonocardiaceae bacterium]|nr:hypothetical protein [Pseudonocardiaceae bacterium]